MLLWGVYLALETSNLPEQFNEGILYNYIMIYYSIKYNSFCCFYITQHN